VLREAEKIIYGDREKTYGDPGKNLRKIASLWSAYLDHPVSAEDAAQMMVLLKISRLINSPGHMDSLTDAAGYLALVERIHAKA
jgi:hypothetical protein